VIEKVLGNNKIRKVGIVGLGYVGLPLALASWEVGFEVYGVDLAAQKIELLKSCSSPIDDVQDHHLEVAISSGRFHISTDYALLADCDVVVICVPTPLDMNGAPDLDSLRSACQELARIMKEGALLVNESTSFPGTVRKVIAPLVQEIRGAKSLLLAVAPERVDPGNQNWNFRNTPRVIGGLNDVAIEITSEFYSTFCDNVIPVSSPEVAELSKLIENSYRLVNIALVNEIANLSTKMGLNIHEVLDAAESKPYGFSRFNPGLGVGGHCIPIDPMYLSWYAENHGETLEIIKLSRKLNEERTKFIAGLIDSHYQSSEAVLVWGLSYKSGIGDLRESPSIQLIDELRRKSIPVNWFDEKIEEWNGEKRTSKLEKGILMIVHDTKDALLNQAINKSRLTFDLTGNYRNQERVMVV
jgi:UDP-N-acetyl-D-glucosamine dehydrogenase